MTLRVDSSQIFNLFKVLSGSTNIFQNHGLFVVGNVVCVCVCVLQYYHDKHIVGEHVHIKMGSVGAPDNEVCEASSKLRNGLFVSLDNVGDFLKSLWVEGSFRLLLLLLLLLHS